MHKEAIVLVAFISKLERFETKLIAKCYTALICKYHESLYRTPILAIITTGPVHTPLHTS